MDLKGHITIILLNLSGAYLFLFIFFTMAFFIFSIDENYNSICTKKYRIEKVFPARGFACWISEEVEGNERKEFTDLEKGYDYEPEIWLPLPEIED